MVGCSPPSGGSPVRPLETQWQPNPHMDLGRALHQTLGRLASPLCSLARAALLLVNLQMQLSPRSQLTRSPSGFSLKKLEEGEEWLDLGFQNTPAGWCARACHQGQQPKWDPRGSRKPSPAACPLPPPHTHTVWQNLPTDEVQVACNGGDKGILLLVPDPDRAGTRVLRKVGQRRASQTKL